ncbi:hypothetical protein K469DRAFT_700706 [Zopfia rhizophila CBS 207.26]|uniref:Uncharacterized protein n=1 Tax=Zopfia rhizophila CBS 207.26 TaxID=1314779 RepID=A0A6A6EF84_9PEZI|nr:hypothetical protein K469DRAFT_700706 [Zopfia rhizophila CBS 207.26]
MERRSRAMAGIHASAEFTIVDAGSEDANSGLRGIGGLAQSRVIERIICNEERNAYL